MTNKNSHEENVRFNYQFMKDAGMDKEAEEYKKKHKQMARMLGNKDPFGAGCLIPIIAILSSVMSFIYFFVVLG